MFLFYWFILLYIHRSNEREVSAGKSDRITCGTPRVSGTADLQVLCPRSLLHPIFFHSILIHIFLYVPFDICAGPQTKKGDGRMCVVRE